MLLYSHTITPRLKYIADFAGKEIFGEPLHPTSDTTLFKQSAGPKINYSPERITSDEYWLKPHSLLFEKNIKPQAVTVFETNGHKAFFKTEGDFPFDIFAASFYLLSRYEEYLPHQKDEYGRYAHKNSLAFKEGFLHLPLINLWLQGFKDSIKQKFLNHKPRTPNLPVRQAGFRLLLTYDIDEAWAYKHKGWWRTAGGTVKSMMKGQSSEIIERRKVLREKMQDPYDSYTWMNELHLRDNLQPLYFFLVPTQTGKYDRNILPDKKELQELIRQHAAHYTIGVHPSWQSGDVPALIKNEIDRIQKITGKSIASSRQHYIRFSLPQTFRQLMDAGIREDFSMGYGSINGFRASVASPFYWYDLEKEEATGLLLHPFCFMDANSFYERKISPLQALDEMRQYYNTVRSVNGTMIMIWHNTILGTGKSFAGWRDVYEQFIKDIS